MCITNKQAEITLMNIREFDKGNLSESQIAEMLVQIKSIKDCLDDAEKRAKIKFQESYSGQVYYFPEHEKKVYLSEGKSSSHINPADFILNMKNAGLENLVPDCVTIVKSKVEATENKEAIKIAKLHTKVESGKPSVSVAKMNKQELIESRV